MTRHKFWAILLFACLATSLLAQKPAGSGGLSISWNQRRKQRRGVITTRRLLLCCGPNPATRWKFKGRSHRVQSTSKVLMSHPIESSSHCRTF